MNRPRRRVSPCVLLCGVLAALVGACSDEAAERCDLVGACASTLAVETTLPGSAADLDGVVARICTAGEGCADLAFVREGDETCVAGACSKPELDPEGRPRVRIVHVVADAPSRTFTVTFTRSGTVLREATQTVSFTAEPGACGGGCPRATFTL